MQYSSASPRPIRATSRHEVRLVWIGVVFSGLTILPLFVDHLTGEWTRVCAGAAGAALVQFAQSEARVWRQHLSLGHQLVFWWNWPLVLPFFAIATRKRRSIGLTVLMVLPIAAFLGAAVISLVVDLLRIYP